MKKDTRDRREEKRIYAETHKEQIKEKNKVSYQKNRDKRIEYSKEYRSKNREEIILRRRENYQLNRDKFREEGRKSASIHRITQYGISVSDYNEMFSNQNGCCAICGKPEKLHHSRLHIDHDHKTGIVRGLLCSKCNQGIGLFNDNIDLLQSAYNYLKGITQ